MRNAFRSAAIVVLITCSNWCKAGLDTTQIECRKSSNFLAPIDSPDYRKYAPDRDVQVLHLALDATPDFKKRTVEGKAVWTFKPIAKPITELKLDAVDLAIHTVESSAKIQAYQNTDTNLIVTFAEPVPAGKETTLTITWHGEPKEGLYFRTPEMGYKEGDTHLFTQGEEIEARHWYPSFDYPNFKFTSEITCHIPKGMTSISNGRLISQSEDPATGLVTFHWSQEKPQANYLVSLAAGYLKSLEDRYRDIPLAFYTPASEIAYASNSFRDTKDMLEFYEHEIGIDYPWAKYDQVCVNDFVAGGMENTSCTTLMDTTLFTDATENIRTSEGLVAHELAHQWFGDLITCKDWSHIWLNESFATYYETLYHEHKDGHDDMLYELYGRTRQITGITNNFKPIVRRTYDAAADMFDYLAYPKGAWVLHMLRSQLGPELYRRCIKTYVERHLYGNVVTDNLRAVVEELSGRSYDQFFDQWLYHGYHPELEVSYSWDEKAKLAKLTVRQTQKVTEEVCLFDLPLTVRFKGTFGALDRPAHLKEKEEDFYFPLDSAPEIVRIDPEYTVLAKVTFKVPKAMLRAQLKDKSDVVGRLLAIEQFSQKKDKDSVAALEDALKKDPFYGVRIEAARALRNIHSDEALEALLASTRQPDARARRAVVLSIADFYRDTAYASAHRTVESEHNPDIIASAVGGLAGYAKPEVRDVLLKYLNSDSFRNELADAAINGIRSQDDPSYISPLIDTLSTRGAKFTTRGLASGLETVAYIGRNEEKKDRPRKFLVEYVNDKRDRVQLAAISGLGTLGDPQALAVVEKFAVGVKDDPRRQAAEKTVETLRAARKPVDDFKNLRQEVLDLEKNDRELRKDLDDVKKKLEAKETERTSKAKPKVSSPKTR